MQPFLTQYLPPMLATVIVALAALLLMWWLASRGVGTRLWRTVVRYRGPLAFLFAVVLFAVAFMTFVVRTVGQERTPEYLQGNYASPANLMYGAGFTQVPFTGTVYTADEPLSSTPPVELGWEAEVPAEHSLVSPLFAVRPRETYNYTFYAEGEGEGEGTRVQGRLLWYDKGLNVLSWDDSPVWPAGQVEYRVGSKRAPEGAAYVRR